MQKNWYIIYTKPKAEKKVSTALTRRKIENFVPMNSRTILKSRKIKIQNEPLFQSYLFANISEADMPTISSLDSVVNFVYWKQHPVIVTDDDILLIKEFTTNYTNIKVQKTEVNMNDIAKVIDGSQRFFSGNVLTIKNTIAKVNLPTIGFSIFAEIEKGGIIHTEITSAEKYLHLQ